RCFQSPRSSRLATEAQLPRARRADGRCRPRATFQYDARRAFADHLTPMVASRLRRVASLRSGTAFSREAIARRYLRGTGIEIGALHNPLRLPRGVDVRYVDRMTVPELRRHYPELAGGPLAGV